MDNILNNEELMQKLADAKTAEELEAVLAANNVVLEEGLTAEKLLDMINNPSAESDELDADALEDVSGGTVWGPIIGYGVARRLIKYISKKRRHGGGGHRF